MFNLLVGPLSNLVGNAIKGFVETKKAKADLALTEIKAQKSLKEQQIAGKISWEASAVDQMKGSWKDELILICLLVPAVAVFIPGWTPHKHLLYIACSASFGIKGAKGAMGLITKKK